MFRIFLLLSFLAYVVHSDPVTFRAFLDCEGVAKFWCGQLVIYEMDDITSNDIMQNVTFCTNGPTKHYKFPPMNPGGDVGSEYEFNYQLRHNCTSDGRMRCIQPKKTQDVDSYYPRDVNFYINPFNAGTLGCRNIGLGPSEIDED